MDKVLHGEVSILISFNVKAFTQLNGLQMLMNSNAFQSSRVSCVIRTNFNLEFIKDKSFIM